MLTTIQAIFADTDSAEAAARSLKENNIEVSAQRITPVDHRRRYDAEFADLFGPAAIYAFPGSMVGNGISATTTGNPGLSNGSVYPPVGFPVAADVSSDRRVLSDVISSEVILKVKIDDSHVDAASGLLINHHGRKIQVLK